MSTIKLIDYSEVCLITLVHVTLWTKHLFHALTAEGIVN